MPCNAVDDGEHLSKDLLGNSISEASMYDMGGRAKARGPGSSKCQKPGAFPTEVIVNITSRGVRAKIT